MSYFNNSLVFLSVVVVSFSVHCKIMLNNSIQIYTNARNTHTHTHTNTHIHYFSIPTTATLAHNKQHQTH